ncbi:MAG: glycerol-3-phosphate dehydrogenase/oxidase [Propionibacteriaceae bacterium]|jgi:glycerol-3-phosphate dehydrogenase|nr:glycerol-3-phosphate dehydrogenase/oxidase [Propionibacteriaceae bacterium]
MGQADVMSRPQAGELAGKEFDLIVIGGGITGVATARDAALRGLSVLLVEKDDFAAGTSSRSSKLIHGGLRYLETYQFKLVAESLRERERQLLMAPHLTQVRPFLYLLYKGCPESRFLLNLGLTFYDVASGEWRKRHHKMLSAREVLAREPHLRPDGLLGAGQYFDVLTDDARLTVDTAKGAAEAGARLLNHAAVTGLVLEAGQAKGVTITDLISGQVFDVRARQVLSATGSWTEQVRAMEGGGTAGRLRPTKGVHIVLKKSDFPLNTAVFLRSPDDNRVVWPTPSLEDDLVYIGTTDTDYSGDPDNVCPDEADIRYLLNVANHTIPDAHLDESHVVGSWAGLRPLVAPAEGTSTSNTSREHVIMTGPSGLLTISGGKLTSSRLMAKQFVDAAERRLVGHPTRSIAGQTPISGGSIQAYDQVRAEAGQAGVPEAIVEKWLARYGANAAKVLKKWQESADAGEVIGPRHLTRAEVRYCVDEEMCRTLSDLMIRRTSLFFWDSTGGTSNDDAIVAELGDLLGWSAAEREQQKRGYRELVERHRPHPVRAAA